MKAIEKERLIQLLHIIPNHPMIRIAHFVDSGEVMPEVLSGFCREKGYEYQINCTDPGFYKTLSEKYRNDACTKLANFSLKRPRYMIQGKLYDFLFVTVHIDESLREDFVKRCHPVIKNGGNILIFIPKGDHAARYEWMRLLEEHYYVATNTIADLFEAYDLLISKKMHGWGG